MKDYIAIVEGLVREALHGSVTELYPGLSPRAQARKVDELFSGLSADEVAAIYSEHIAL